MGNEVGNDVLAMQLQVALADHLQWEDRVLRSPNTSLCIRRCPTEQWFAELSDEIRASVHYNAVHALHQRVHVELSAVAFLQHNDDTIDGHLATLEEASRDLTKAFDRWIDAVSFGTGAQHRFVHLLR